MAMQVNCKYYETRTYASGDVVRKCRLDLAPEAPWNCPADCPSFEFKLIGGGFDHGTLFPTGGPADVLGADGVAELLEEAENIVNFAVGDTIAEMKAEKLRNAKAKKGRGWRFWRK